MAAMAAGLSLEEAVDKPVVLTVISPLSAIGGISKRGKKTANRKPCTMPIALEVVVDEYEEPAMDAGTRDIKLLCQT